jgi:tetratricopeptide (TPR) repeat protein
MEIPIEVQESIDLLMKYYNLVISDVKHYDNPSLYMLLMKFLFPNYEIFSDHKPNEIIAALVVVMMIYNDEVESEEDLEEHVLRKLKVISKRVLIYNIVDHMLYELDPKNYTEKETMEHSKELETEKILPPGDEDVLLEIRDEVVHLIINNKGEILSPPDEKPFSNLQKIQEEKDIDLELMEQVNTVVFKAQKNNDPMTDIYAYSLLHICPYAYTTMSVLLSSSLEEEQYIDLLKLIVQAFLLTHPDLDKEERDDFYHYDDYREYILALDSLGFIYKNNGKYEESIFYYEQILDLDKEDNLGVKEAVIFDYLMSLRYEDMEHILDELPNDSVYKTYFILFATLKEQIPFHEEYIRAFDASPLIMKFICEKDTNLYAELNQKERSFIEDFYQIYISDEVIVKPLIDLYKEE